MIRRLVRHVWGQVIMGWGFGKCTKSGDVSGEGMGCVKRVELEEDKASPEVAMYQESDRAMYQERPFGSAQRLAVN